MKSPSSPPPGELLAATTVYKGTTLPHVVVRRTAQLFPGGFTTCQAEKGAASGKFWALHRRCTLDPPDAAAIKAHERHLRKAGPLRAVASYARDKNMLRLYCFRIEWPDKHAPSHGSVVELGFDSLAAAREWHGLLASKIQALPAPVAVTVNSGRPAGSSGGGGGVEGRLSPCEVVSAAASPDSSLPNTPLPIGRAGAHAPPAPPAGASPRDSGGGGGMAPGGMHGPELGGTTHGSGGGGGGSGGGGRLARYMSTGSSIASSNWSPQGQGERGDPSASDAGGRGGSSAGSGGSGGGGGGGGDGPGLPAARASGGSLEITESVRGALQASSVGAGHSSGVRAAGGGGGGGAARGAAGGAPSPARGGGGGANGGANGSGASGGGVVVDEGSVRWVPYKHSNGMAVYYRHAPRGERVMGAAQKASGEYMLSVAVAASPERCVAALQSRRGRAGGSAVSVAAHVEVLEDRGDVQVRHMVFHPAGSAGAWGALCAPREAFVTQVLTSYEEGVYNILFNSIPDEDLRPEWRARAAARARSADTASRASDPTASRRLWRGHPVRAKITGAFTLSALEGKGSRDSPQTLVTTILRADFGGWLSPGSPFFMFGWALGLHEAFMDRLLMTVMILREEVEYSRFRTKPFQLLMAAATSANERPPAPASPSAAVAAHHQRRPSVGAVPGGGGGAGAAAGGSLTLGRSETLAAAAASAVSSAASALAAHMTEPNQLWRRNKAPAAPAAAAADGGGKPGTPAKGGAAEGAAAAGERAGGGGAPAEAAAAPEVPESPTTAAAIAAAADAAAAAATAAGAGRVAAAAAAAAAAQAAAAAAGLAPAPRYSAEDLEAWAEGGSMDPAYWEPIHVPGAAQVFSIRGPNYLKDRKKIPAGTPRFRLLACDLVSTPTVIGHVARFLPSIRLSGCPFMFAVNLLIPGTGSNPCLHLVMTFGAPSHPSALGACPDDPLDAGPEWTPFDFALSRFLHAGDYERNGTFKLIPHCAKGSWILCQTVGTTPVILGRKLPTTSYVLTDRYVEVDVNVATNPAVSYVVSMVQGATKSMVIDHAYLLEGHFAHELPEALIGAVRFKHLDMGQYVAVDTAHEIRMAPVDPDWQ
ncbi:hypothetical protein Rsub_05311 [Raphidocelis subcapitata]|uniref:Protein ENHANCED DISEASE RESISTANCE 2 C-terminal domain-containing protein n=1 Tax=Raphidocelis subcapitata TaxID=307507 RepID=A0A2V0NY16_9CHLO|nr:hypothetical protein Rsub_05311 [Raphidocelis subcapitata]|eukprot:GBF92229.1 hypothetical protein Rsub_05311 [Raphidocelis subcapitata]